MSGGLDSTHALIVAARAMDLLGLPRTNILGYTMPGFATGTASKSFAWRLMEALGITASELDIRPTARQMLEGLGHPFARGEDVYDVTFENVQAGLRTDYLFRLANHHKAIVLGTGDLSEPALSSTYGGRPDVALQRQRRSAEDADPAPDPLGQWARRLLRPGGRGPPVDPECGDLARADSGQGGRGRRAPRRPSACTSCRTSTCSTRCASATGRRRSPSLTTPGPTSSGLAARVPAGAATRVRRGGDPAVAGRLCPAVLRFLPVQAVGNAQRAQGLARRSLSPRGDWRAPRTATPRSGSPTSSGTCPLREESSCESRTAATPLRT